jgi:hypothetical protein
MCAGIALAYSEIPLDLIEAYQLQSRVHDRGGEKEIRFLYRDRSPCLPVVHDGQLTVVRWGNSGGQSPSLPRTGWTWQSKVEEGGWSHWDAVQVVIPATAGVENGVWFRIKQGIRGLRVPDGQAEPVVYMVCEKASHYFQVMTRSERMPVLIGERI